MLVAKVPVRVRVHRAIIVGMAVCMNQVRALQQRGVAQQIARRATGDDPPILKHKAVVGDLFDNIEIVRGGHYSLRATGPAD